jgi:DNA-binding transcriptional MerR regulator
MNFTPGQVQEMLGLSPATFRHWKKELPPLRGRNGYTPCFSPGDLLAIALIKLLTEEIGISVSRLSDLAIEVFKHLSQSWAGLERSVLVIEPTRHRVSTAPETQALIFDAPAITVPLRPIVASLRERLLREQPDDQQELLRFPPNAIVGTRRSTSQ